MIRYAKGAAPPELRRFAETPGADWNGFHDRQEVREALVRDQAALCAYCQRRIRASADANPKMKIEHWLARNTAGAPTHEFEWNNLLGVCAGDTLGERHCDTSRGDRPPVAQGLYLHPVQGQGPDPREHLRYTRIGEVLSERKSPQVEDDIATLNLNARVLRRAREAVLDRLEQTLTRRGFTPANLRRVLAEHRIEPGTTAPEHSEVVRYYVSRKLRRQGLQP